MKSVKLSRRTVMAGAAAASALAGSTGASAQGSANVLRVVMHSDLRIIDPIWTTAYIVRNHGYMIYDTLFAVDDKRRSQPQMVDKYDRQRRQADLDLHPARRPRCGTTASPSRPTTCIASIQSLGRTRSRMGQTRHGLRQAS